NRQGSFEQRSGFPRILFSVKSAEIVEVLRAADTLAKTVLLGYFNCLLKKFFSPSRVSLPLINRGKIVKYYSQQRMTWPIDLLSDGQRTFQHLRCARIVGFVDIEVGEIVEHLGHFPTLRTTSCFK